MSDLIGQLEELACLMEKTKDAAKQGYKDKTLYNIADDIGTLKGIIDNAKQANGVTTGEKQCNLPVVKKRALTDYVVVLILGGATFLTALFHFIKSMFF